MTKTVYEKIVYLGCEAFDSLCVIGGHTFVIEK